MANPLKVLTVAPKKNHTATVIFMHGLGDTGYGWKPVADQLARDPAFQHIKWILPHAPIVSCTANGGMPMPGWYDIIDFSFALAAREDVSGVLESKDKVNELIKQEIDSGTPANRIVLGGFSQGGAMSLVTGLTTEHKLAGLTVLSGYFAIRERVEGLIASHATTLPIFWGHGEEDPLVPLSIAERSKEELRGVGVNEAKEFGQPGISYRAYPGLDHSADAAEINDWTNWLKKVIPS